MTAEELARAQALRGMVRHFRRVYARAYAPETFARDWVGPLWATNRHYGRCVWCDQPCESRKRWHPECARQYVAARGQTVSLYGPLLEAGPCEGCGAPGREVDHRLALSVAHALGYRWHIRAHLLQNLRWLCTKCHNVKTAEDRRTLRAVQIARHWQAEVDAIASQLRPLSLPDHVTPRQGRLF